MIPTNSNQAPNVRKTLTLNKHNTTDNEVLNVRPIRPYGVVDYTVIDYLKREAKKLSRSKQIKLNKAQDEVAVSLGYVNYQDVRIHLKATLYMEETNSTERAVNNEKAKTP